MNVRDLTGKRFGKLVVAELAGRRKGSIVWRCLCDCGRETTVRGALLNYGQTKSCGCLANRPGGGRQPKPPKIQQRRASRVTIPQNVHPAVAYLFAEMRRQRMTYEEVAALSGVLKSTIKKWRTDNAPALPNLERALNAVGATLVAQPMWAPR